MESGFNHAPVLAAEQRHHVEHRSAAAGDGVAHRFSGAEALPPASPRGLPLGWRPDRRSILALNVLAPFAWEVRFRLEMLVGAHFSSTVEA